MKNKKPGGRLYNWKLALLEYDFEIIHKAGAQNVVADALSRISLDDLINLEQEDRRVLALTRARAAEMNEAEETTPSRFLIRERPSTLLTPRDIDHIFFLFNIAQSELKLKLELKTKNKLTNMQPYTAYQIGECMTAIMLPEIIRNSEQAAKAQEVLQLILRQCEQDFHEKIAVNLEFSDHISYTKFKQLAENIFADKDVDITFYLNKTIELTDASEIQKVMKAYHLSLLGGHTGMNRTLNRIRQFYHWPNMKKNIISFIGNCTTCKQTKVTKNTKMPIEIVSTASKPFETVFIDTVGPIYPATEDGNLHIFTCECDLTKFAIATPIPDTTAATVAKAFVESVMLRHRIPEKVLADNGTCFTADLFKNVTKLLNIKQKHIAPYNPKANLVERLHRSLNQYLRAYAGEDRTNWDRYLPFAINSYNNTPHSTTGACPHELLYGYVNEIPTKVMRNNAPVYNYDNYAEELRTRLQHAHRLAKEKCDAAKQRNTDNWNESLRPINVDIGDRIFIRNKTKSHKFDTEYTGPHIVIEKVSPTSVKAKRGRKTITAHIDTIILAPPETSNSVISPISENA